MDGHSPPPTTIMSYSLVGDAVCVGFGCSISMKFPSGCRFEDRKNGDRVDKDEVSFCRNLASVERDGLQIIVRYVRRGTKYRGLTPQTSGMNLRKGKATSELLIHKTNKRANSRLQTRAKTDTCFAGFSHELNTR